MVGLAGSPPAEGGCVQMLSSATEDKFSEVNNGVNISCRFLVSVNVYLLVPNTVVIRSTIPKKRVLNAGDRVRTHVPCAYSQLHAVISTIILYATFLVTAKTRTDISLRKSSTDCRRSI